MPLKVQWLIIKLVYAALRQAAKRVREVKKGARADESEPSLQDTVGILRARIVELETENTTLRKQLEALTA